MIPVALVSIDPGLCTGWAAWGIQGLLSCGLGEVWPNASAVIIEKPQIYQYTPPKQANDLLTLAVRVGEYKNRCSSLGAQVTTVIPHAWKGSLHKTKHHPRIWAVLVDREREVVRRATNGMPISKVHNMVDAIGLGLFALDRLTPTTQVRSQHGTESQ